MLAEMQSAMNNMVDNQLQNDFQLASISSSSSSSSSSPCPGVTIALQPQPSAVPLTPTSPAPASSSSPPPPPMCQSPCPSPPPSPRVASTITAVARAHRETFVYAHDKLSNPHTSPPQQLQNNHTHHNGGEEEHWGPNRCPNGYHAIGLNTIYHHNNNLETGRCIPDNSSNITPRHTGNGKRNLHNSNLNGGVGLSEYVTQGQNCPMKNRTGIVLVGALFSSLPTFI